MNIFIPHSTSNRGLNATSQAPQELGDSKKFLELRYTSGIYQKINPLQVQKGDRHNKRCRFSPTTGGEKP